MSFPAVVKRISPGVNGAPPAVDSLYRVSFQGIILPHCVSAIRAALDAYQGGTYRIAFRSIEAAHGFNIGQSDSVERAEVQAGMAFQEITCLDDCEKIQLSPIQTLVFK